MQEALNGIRFYDGVSNHSPDRRYVNSGINNPETALQTLLFKYWIPDDTYLITTVLDASVKNVETSYERAYERPS